MLIESECDGVFRDTKSANGGGDWRDTATVVIVPPEIHPFFHLKDVITPQQRAHIFTHALPAVLIEFGRLEGRDKEIEGAKRGAEG